MLYAFGDYTLDPVRYELRCAGGLVPVAPRACDSVDSQGEKSYWERIYAYRHSGRSE